jgi:flagellar biogenesis protein FliO
MRRDKMLTHELAVSIGGLILTIGLLFAARPLIRRLGPMHRANAPHRLSIAATLPLDRTRKLTLVQVDGHHALILTGGASDQLFPWPAPDNMFRNAMTDATTHREDIA